jgi:hypothetical protein
MDGLLAPAAGTLTVLVFLLGWSVEQVRLLRFFFCLDEVCSGLGGESWVDVPFGLGVGSLGSWFVESKVWSDNFEADALI